jgi:diketogulonate reductase-like aldo/keto reductase
MTGAVARAADAATRPATTPSGAPMLTRPIPSTGQQVPVVGMGTWQTFDPEKKDPDTVEDLRQVLKTFHAAGGRVIDSSPMYGKAEEVVGELSQELGINAELFLATKVWTRGERAGIEQMNDSLGKLRRDTLELMQVHNLLDWQTHLKTLRAWKEQGKIRYIGVTHYQRSAFDDLERIMKAEKVDFVQLPYSVDHRDAEQRLLPTAKDTGTAVITLSPFGGGGLFGKVRGKELPDHVKGYANSWAQAFLKFLLADERVTCVIPATSKPRHMADNVQAGVGRLPTPDEREQLARLFE